MKTLSREEGGRVLSNAMEGAAAEMAEGDPAVKAALLEVANSRFNEGSLRDELAQAKAQSLEKSGVIVGLIDRIKSMEADLEYERNGRYAELIRDIQNLRATRVQNVNQEVIVLRDSLRRLEKELRNANRGNERLVRQLELSVIHLEELRIREDRVRRFISDYVEPVGKKPSGGQSVGAGGCRHIEGKIEMTKDYIAALEALDMDWAREAWPGLKNDERRLVNLHKRRAKCVDIRDELRHESVEWLRAARVTHISALPMCRLPPPGELPE